MSKTTTVRGSMEQKAGEEHDLYYAATEKAATSLDQDVETGTQSTRRQGDAPDPAVVDWDGPGDPENPMNWPQHKKIANIGLISLFTFVTPLASSIFAPAIDLVMEDFEESSPELASFIVSIYLLGYCFGPLVIAPLSEVQGRVRLYHVCNILFLIWTVACALSPNIGALLAFRLLAGLAGSCPMTIGAGTITDMIPQENRGKYMASWIFGPIWGPVIGPVAGGYLSQALGWRWSLWLVAIVTGVIIIPSLFYLKESSAVVLLQRKASRMQRETGNEKLRSKLDTHLTRKEILRLAIVRPTKMLLFSPVCFIMALYLAFIYGQVYILLTALGYVFDIVYGFDTGEVGLTFLGFGVGALIGLVIAGIASDRVMHYLVRVNGGKMLPKYRLPMCILGGILAPIGLLWFGWAAEQKTHWIVPIIGTGLFGGGGIFVMMNVQTYLVDAFPHYAASAIAANMVFRSLVGALLPLSGRKLFESMGVGWGNSLLAFIGFALVPFPLILYRYGESIRQKTLFGVKF